jgi:hypothetical protein
MLCQRTALYVPTIQWSVLGRPDRLPQPQVRRLLSACKARRRLHCRPRTGDKYRDCHQRRRDVGPGTDSGWPRLSSYGMLGRAARRKRSHHVWPTPRGPAWRRYGPHRLCRNGAVAGRGLSWAPTRMPGLWPPPQDALGATWGGALNGEVRVLLAPVVNMVVLWHVSEVCVALHGARAIPWHHVKKAFGGRCRVCLQSESTVSLDRQVVLALRMQKFFAIAQMVECRSRCPA